MKKNIVLICLNDYLLKQVSADLVKKLKANWLDIDGAVENELLRSKGDKLHIANEFLTSLERKIISQAVTEENTIFSISPEMFLANSNKEYFHECSCIYLATETHSIDILQIKNKAEKTRIIQNATINSNLNEFLINSCEYVIQNADIKEIADLVKEIKALIK